MPRRRPDDLVKARMWSALLNAAKEHHEHPADHGMLSIIAADAGVSRSSVWEWKKGLSYPEDDTIRALADLYGKEVDDISGFENTVANRPDPEKLLDRAADITELVVVELLPDGTTAQFLKVMRRAHQLLLEGKSDDEARGLLFHEVIQSKREAASEH